MAQPRHPSSILKFFIGAVMRFLEAQILTSAPQASIMGL
jgi:hypothetical protein